MVQILTKSSKEQNHTPRNKPSAYDNYSGDKGGSSKKEQWPDPHVILGQLAIHLGKEKKIEFLIHTIYPQK